MLEMMHVTGMYTVICRVPYDTVCIMVVVINQTLHCLHIVSDIIVDNINGACNHGKCKE